MSVPFNFLNAMIYDNWEIIARRDDWGATTFQRYTRSVVPKVKPRCQFLSAHNAGEVEFKASEKGNDDA